MSRITRILSENCCFARFAKIGPRIRYAPNRHISYKAHNSLPKIFPKIQQFKTIQKRSIFIQTEQTPNENALKFITGTDILKDGEKSIEVRSRKEAIGCPFAIKIFGTAGIEALFFGKDFITVVKDPDYQWNVLKPEIFSILMEHVSTDQQILSDLYKEKLSKPLKNAIKSEDEDLNQIISEITELLDTRVRPSIMEDGGDIEFVSFDLKTGILKVSLQGACRGCSSSEVTLKNGIESMLKYYIPEVTLVENIGSELEELSKDQFNKLENNLYNS
ncbi:hypothetical protein BB561_006549 [Smittium simulii]|uniref:Scaffold protein Nfu/NifU N-terminal domain-containing protein n=1 Tax=Smittium simulii TaxID=133385 RepID=A0A2T9Y379_9FUNG|nr:hypothetical protein BB561_006549 [Smittium simulii]